MLKVFNPEMTQYALKLEEQADGSVIIRIVNALTGAYIRCGNLATIAKCGLYRHSKVNKEVAEILGIPLDDSGRIHFEVEEEE